MSIINKFNEAVNFEIKINPVLYKKIKETYTYFKKIFQKKGLSVIKLSDFKYKTFYWKTKILDLDIVITKFYPSQKSFSIIEMTKIIISCLEKSSTNYQIKKHQNYMIISEEFEKYTIKYRVLPLIRKAKSPKEINQKLLESKNILKNEHEELFKKYKKTAAGNKKQKKEIYQELKRIEYQQHALNQTKNNYFLNKDIINKNVIIQNDLSLLLTESFVNANKISNGTLYSVKKILNYVLKNHFKYSYNVDMLLITWFYEYLARSLNDYLDDKYNKQNKELDVLNFLKTKNLKQWFKNHINIMDLYYFVFTKLGQTNTYFFQKLAFDEYELFADISRYSLNTNSTFKISSSFFSQIKIFDLKNYENLTFLQTNLSNDNGYSKIIYDKARNEEKRYFTSPLIVSGISNYPSLAKWIDSISNSLKMTLGNEAKKEIETFRSREVMEEINQIGHNWLSSYWSKLKYLSPYFDRKYPLVSQFDIKTLIFMITTMVDKTNEKSWILKNDN